MRAGGDLNQADAVEWREGGSSKTWEWVGYDIGGFMRARNVSGITLRFPDGGGTIC